MLLYFYLLCLAICVDWIFCYEYISDRNSYRVRRLKKDARASHRRQSDAGRRGKARHDHKPVNDKNPRAEIDIASFIQKPDYDAVEKTLPYELRSKKRKEVSKDYDEYSSAAEFNLEDSDENKNQKLLLRLNNPHDSDSNPVLYKDLTNRHHTNLNAVSLNGLERSKKGKPRYGKATNTYHNEYVMNKQLGHKQDKKCSIKAMKFPFFSHKKSETHNTSNEKKRHFFHFSSPDKEATSNLPDLSDADLAAINKLPYGLYRINKRSYEVLLCPVCRKRFTANLDKNVENPQKLVSNKIIHNSRQYYQDMSDAAKESSTSEFSNFRYAEDTNNNGDSKMLTQRENTEEDDAKSEDVESRRKRDNAQETERQLKELEEVQKKVDGVQMPSTNYWKVNPMQSQSQ